MQTRTFLTLFLLLYYLYAKVAIINLITKITPIIGVPTLERQSQANRNEEGCIGHTGNNNFGLAFITKNLIVPKYSLSLTISPKKT